MGSAIAFLHDVESRQLRQQNLQQSAALQIVETDARVGSHHDFVQFHLNAFAAYNFDAAGHSFEGLERLGLNLEIQLGGKADAAHHAQRIVRKSDIRLKGCGYDSVFQISKSVERVYQFAKAVAIQTDGHGIDSEVAAVLVVFQRAVLHDRLAGVVAVAFLAGTNKLNLYQLGVIRLRMDGSVLSGKLHLCSTETLEYRQVGFAANLLG